jgi:putative transcriptional regulator
MANIANRIRRLRFDHNEMTQEELAKQAGCTRQTIIALEQGKYVPSIELAFSIARVFAVSLEEVFQYEEQ